MHLYSLCRTWFNLKTRSVSKTVRQDDHVRLRLVRQPLIASYSLLVATRKNGSLSRGGGGRLLLSAPRGGGGLFGALASPDPPPDQKNFPPAKTEMYQRRPKFEADFRYTNSFLASNPPSH